MPTIFRSTISFRYWATVLTWVAFAAAGPTAFAEVIRQFDEQTLLQSGIEFQRGVFRIEENGVRIVMLCIPVKGQWKEVGNMRDCGNPPPKARQREITRFANDATFLGVRNLGISTEQWRIVQRTGSSSRPRNALTKVGEALSIQVGPADVRWRFDSQKLPEELKTPIPGAAIAIHFGGNFSKARRPRLFGPGNEDFQVEARFAVPTFSHSGKAHSGITVAVDLDVPTTAGGRAGLPVIVSLFHPGQKGGREAVRSDGRVSYVSSFLGPGNKYLSSVENRRRSSPWSEPERFAFKLTRENVRRILADANAYRQKTKAQVLYEPQLDQIDVSSVTLRNENRFLNQGDVTIVVVVDYFRILGVTASR